MIGGLSRVCYAITLFVVLGFCSYVSTAAAAELRKVRVVKSELNGVRKPYSTKKVADPFGGAPVPRVERFELREGLCRASDCEFRPSTRARIEKQSITELQDGDEAWFAYSVLFPSREFNVLPGVRSTFGQLFLNRSLSSWGGVPIWDLQTDKTGRKLFVQMKQADPEDQLPKKRTLIGEIGRSLPFDRWIDVKVHVKLSTNPDGFLVTYVNNKKVAQIKAPTIWPGARLEYDYGIYQSGTSDWAAANGGNLKAIPRQVIYYSGVRIGSVN